MYALDKNNREAKSGFTSLKHNMSKDYDWVKWNFLRVMMIKMVFVESWVNLIMKCVNSVSYSFLFNHWIIGTFNQERDLIQGVSLSPYLFVLCDQGLSSIYLKQHKIICLWEWGLLHLFQLCTSVFLQMIAWFSSRWLSRIVFKFVSVSKPMNVLQEKWLIMRNLSLP